MKYNINGSTIIEAVAASIIFLITFCFAVEMITRVSSIQRDDSLLIAEADIKTCLNKFSTTYYERGEYLFSYGWGEIAVTISQYRQQSGVRELNFKITIARGNRIVNYRILTAIEP